MKPVISIIIPTYNRADLIGETLDSLMHQSYLNWECIVVDDGSTDNTLKVMQDYIQKDVRIRYYHRPPHRTKGPNACRNFGFELSNGDYIKWFDSDDIFVDNSLEIISKFFYDKNDVIVSSLEYVTSELNKIGKRHNFISDNIIEDYLVGKISYFTFTPTWKKSFLTQQIELFDEEISNLDDWDFNLRMLYKNPQIVYVNKPLILYRIHNSSLSYEINKFNFQEIESEFKARFKHVKLLDMNNLVDSKILVQFIKGRYKYFLREALVSKHHKVVFLLKKTLILQMRTYDFRSFFKTLFGFTTFRLSGKGYKFLK
jgi:glycosyltransferase involved in cell wall biosynthesis